MCILFDRWYIVLVLENRRLCLGTMCGSMFGAGCECIVHCSVLFRMDMLNSVLMCVPLMLFWLWSYQVVSLALKSPTIIVFGMLTS